MLDKQHNREHNIIKLALKGTMDLKKLITENNGDHLFDPIAAK